MYRHLGLAFFAVHLLCAPAFAAEPALQALARKEIGADHGVFVRAENGEVLVALNSTRPYHPASVTKVATTLAFLSKLRPDRRFRTRFLAAGPVDGGTLHGDLIVRAEGDPYFLFANAFRVLLALRDKGIGRVNGAIRVEGPFYFDWTPDPAGRRLRRVWTGRLAADSWPVVTRALFPGASMPLKDFALRFGRRAARKRSEARPPRVLVVHASPPLLRHLKDFNSHSNDNFHEFSYQIGGAEAVQRILRASVTGVPKAAIVIDNAAGDGRNNQLSPRAVVAMFAALKRTLRKHGLSFSNVLPVAGVDPGTLQDRLAAARYRGAVVGKSGTVRVLRIGTLAGVAHTRKYGRTFFAIMTRGVPLWIARERQNAFLKGLLDAAGARPLPAGVKPPPAFMEARLEAPR
ncbi:MAG: D-alanyl-D-alanine carboxypeptidase [Deltaproteobacteria bacterium]|nr:D-alanyl-D-alanine carboxypeptidase [Deltaproteobacteria bacterium]